MKKFLFPLAGLVFLAFSCFFIAFIPGFRSFIPARQVELSHGVEYGAVLKDFLFVQEITMEKRYLSGIDVYMAKLPSQYVNNNVFVLIDENRRILHTQRFSSADFGEALHFPFRFGRSFDIGMGKMVYACIYSTDGDQQTYIGLARKESGTIGKLCVMPILNNDVLQSFSQRQSVVDFRGSLGIRTYEADSQWFSAFQVLLMMAALLVAVLVATGPLWYGRVLKIRLRPEFVFLSVAVPFGITMSVITPPFQVPDEPVHFFRTYQVTEFNFLKLKDDFPASLKQLADSCNRMQFSTHEKTSRTEILSLSKIPLNPSARVTAETPNYTLPYLPQAIGVALGKMAGLQPLWLLYLGRIFNLLATLTLVFAAVRTTPVFKWVFTCLALFPMALYQFASLSYDAVTIGLSFLLMAWILRMAYGKEEIPLRRHLAGLFLLTLALAASKPPYFLLLLIFFIIPLARFGRKAKYLAIFSALLLTALVVSQLWSPVRTVAGKIAGAADPHREEMPLFFPPELGPERTLMSSNPLAMALPLLPHSGYSADEGQPAEGKTSATSPAVDAQAPGPKPFDPGGQVRFILENPFRYAGILLSTLNKSANLYAVSFVGLFGWIDTQVPDVMAYLAIMLILLLSLFSGVPGIKISFRDKAVLAMVMLVVFSLVETALYLYCNPVGSDHIIAVQGRYFIAFSPLLFLLFYNLKFSYSPSARQVRTGSRSLKTGTKTHTPVVQGERKREISALLPLIAVIYGVIILLFSLHLILDRFYVMTL